ncbi:phage repressor protein [Photobacterium frigidiphilum]|uniref:Phage repressor protein n=1 Tax=Photobacterium frigidiphilum TaxID=264736 RepID=A0A2T3J6D2_9GAMM|nr:S24 family peptidase [Photobacterium frigidiphilum]PSU43033.1 phage repressor protein [Photobacterium frigidiphilum]
MKFADRLKSKRKLRGLTQKMIAEAIGVSKVAVSRWELGHSVPTGDTLNSLAKYISCDPEWLLSGRQSECRDVVMVRYCYDIKAAAGNGYMNDSDEQELMPIPKAVIDKQTNKKSVCCIKVSGNSMEPVLSNGSVIALNPHKQIVHDGMMYVIRQGDLLRVKILIETPNEIIIRSYNKDFCDEIYKKNEGSDFEVIGQVFWYSSCINI